MLKAGILGGGQLGRMLLQQAANYPVETFVLESDPGCPAAHLCHHFVKGDIRNFEDVYHFGKGLDALTIEIEAVNVEALEKLESEGIRVYPKASALRIINNKIIQKDFYKSAGLPSPDYITVKNKTDLEQQILFLPAIQKLAEGGYDGRGVQVLKTADDLSSGFDEPSVLEKLVDIHQEISVIIGINEKGETAVFPPVEMVFNQELNLLDYQICPADLDDNLVKQIGFIALKVVTSLQSPGLFAVELFVDKEGTVYVNETAPRVHNSGHHTIEGNFCSQYDMLWRILLDFPLGNPGLIAGSALINLTGEKNYEGEVKYQGLPWVLSLNNAFVHLYGKRTTRPGRKMGLVTLIGDDREELIGRAKAIRQAFKITA